MNMDFLRKLPIPMDIKAQFPISDETVAVIAKRNKEIADCFTGKSDKLILIIGPCSADREDAVMEYLQRLKRIQEQVSDRILIVPRIYTNKPRTTGEGYKGMATQPDPQKPEDMLEGLIAVRNLHTRAIVETGFTCADEMLYPENHRYISDLLGYIAIGARSVENQQHRLTASGMDVPVGMKNPTGGDLSVMLNAIKAAQMGHTFLYRGWEVVSKGNPLTHAIMRGYVDQHGRSHPNYHYEDLALLQELYAAQGLENMGVIIDCNHANSGKQFEQQIRISKEVLHSCRHNGEIAKMMRGFMIESYLVDGCQKPSGDVYGQSITDPCLGWEKTERLILELADLWHA